MKINRDKDAAAVRVVPPLVPLATILAGVGLNRLAPIGAALDIPAPERHWIGGLIVAVSFALLSIWSVVIFRKSGQDEKPWKPTPEIVERGPYRITRNPMYLQMLIGCVGFAVILVDVWILILTPVCAIVLQKLAIEPEEAYLESKFGEAYLAYKRRVRRWV